MRDARDAHALSTRRRTPHGAAHAAFGAAHTSLPYSTVHFATQRNTLTRTARAQAQYSAVQCSTACCEAARDARRSLTLSLSVPFHSVPFRSVPFHSISCGTARRRQHSFRQRSRISSQWSERRTRSRKFSTRARIPQRRSSLLLSSRHSIVLCSAVPHCTALDAAHSLCRRRARARRGGANWKRPPSAASAQRNATRTPSRSVTSRLVVCTALNSTAQHSTRLDSNRLHSEFSVSSPSRRLRRVLCSAVQSAVCCAASL